MNADNSNLFASCVGVVLLLCILPPLIFLCGCVPVEVQQGNPMNLLEVALRKNDHEAFAFLLSAKSIEATDAHKANSGFDVSFVFAFLQSELPLKDVKEEKFDGSLVYSGISQSDIKIKLTFIRQAGLWKLDIVDDIAKWQKFERWISNLDKKMKALNPIP
jgi:hypothetical protein